MGYYTSFSGSISIEPALNAEEVQYLKLFSLTRRMNRRSGPYHAVDDGNFGQNNEPDIIDYNRPPAGQPGLWCMWEPSEDGTELLIPDEGKHYDVEDWLEYLIEHFLRPGALAVKDLPFLQANHVLNGVVYAQGEEDDDRWRLLVEDNEVTRQAGSVVYG